MGVLVQNSQIKTFNRCRRQWYYKYKKGLITKRSTQPLKRGTWLHELLEAHYDPHQTDLGVGWRGKLVDLSKEYDRLFDEEKELYGNLPEICRNIMESYEYHYRSEDKDFDVIAVEESFRVDLPHGHTFEGKFDQIIEDDYGRWLWENKSHKTIPRDDYRFLDMQTSRYLWALNKLDTYGQLNGVIWNYIRTKVPSKPKMTKTGRLSKARLDTDVLTYYRALLEYGLDPNDFRDVLSRLKKHQTFFRRVRVPRPAKVVETLVKEAVVVADDIDKGVIPIRSIERGCEFACSFRDICIVDLYGGDRKDVLKLYRKATSEDYYAYHDEDKIPE